MPHQAIQGGVYKGQGHKAYSGPRYHRIQCLQGLELNQIQMLEAVVNGMEKYELWLKDVHYR